MILRVEFNKRGYLKFLGHLDLVRLFTRAFIKSGIDIKYSEGFNPHPKFSIGNPLSLGIESLSEYMDIELNNEQLPQDVIKALNNSLPRDIQILKAVATDSKSSLTQIIKWSKYDIGIFVENEKQRELINEAIEKLLALDEIIIMKKRKKGKKKIEAPVSIKPWIREILIKDEDQYGYVVIEATLKTGEGGNLKPIELVKAIKDISNIPIDLDMTRIVRTGLYKEKGNSLEKPI